MATYGLSISSGTGEHSVTTACPANSNTYSGAVYTVPSGKYAILTGMSWFENSGGITSCQVLIRHSTNSGYTTYYADSSGTNHHVNFFSSDPTVPDKLNTQIYLGPDAAIQFLYNTPLLSAANVTARINVIEFE